jgi:hypothetical protein
LFVVVFLTSLLMSWHSDEHQSSWFRRTN